MKKFSAWLGKEVVHDRVKDSERLASWGITCRFLPDPPDIFDEYEFGIDYESRQDRAFLVTVENGKISRMLFGATDPDNPDILRPLSDEDIASLQERCGGNIEEFFEFITSK